MKLEILINFSVTVIRGGSNSVKLMSIYLPTKMSFHYFEAAGHATVYNLFRPRPPEELVKRIVDFLVKKKANFANPEE